MDKYEFKISLNEINALIGERRFEEAANIADGIDWNHVKSAETLCRISEVYKAIGEYDRSRDIMAIAHEREADNPVIIYALCELTIFLYGRDGLQSDLTLALQLMQEYQTMEPSNPKRLILQYKMYCVSPVSDGEKIAVLEQLHKEKASGRWDYELAKLYLESGNQEQAAELCRSIQNRFAGSRYAEQAASLVKGSSQAAPEENIPAAPASAEQENAGSEMQEELPQESADSAPRAEEPAEETEEAPAFAGEEPIPPLTEDDGEDPEADGQSVQAARELERRTLEEKEEEREEEESADLPIRTAEEQHNVDSIQSNVAEGMQDIYARPYDDKLEQETSGQYSMVMDSPSEPDPQVDGQLSISEVMAEWEKIRSDIRRSNDEKRAQRIMEDTGSLMQDFDETARHGLLEDIEKGVARQRRQVRSGMYRMASELPERETYPGAAGDGRRMPERDPYRRPAVPQRPAERAPRADEDLRRPPVRRKAPELPEEDDTRVYHRGDEVEEARTRRWNSEEVRRAMARGQEAAQKDGEETVPTAPAEEPAAAVQADRRNLRKAAPVEEYEEPARTAAPAEEAYEEPEETAAAPAEEVYEEQETVEDTPVREYAEPEEEYEEPAQEYEEESVPSEEYGEEPEEEYEEAEEETSAEEYDEEPEEAPAEEYEEPVRRPAAGRRPAPEPERRKARRAEGTASEKKAVLAEEPLPAKEKASAGKPAPAGNAAPAAKSAPASGGKRPLSREERRLFGPFCRMRENVEQLTEALDQISLASSTGNLLILGNEATSDRVAKGILEITRKTDSNFTGKVAKVSGEALNKLSPEGVRKTFVKLESGALIVNKASELAPKTMERLYQELEGREHGIILILVDGNKKMEQFRHENEKYLGSFTAVITVRPLDDKALVAYAKDYAMSQDFSIDEFGQLALAQRISAMQTSTHQVTLKEVRDLVDEAIGYAEKKTPHTLIEVLSKRRYDENDRIIIHEKDFMHN